MSMFPYGTQYFREPNPPESEWEKDFEQIAKADFNMVKIWAMWSWMHVDEDKFEFDNIDRMFELAQKNGLKIIVNTILENAPYWLAQKHPEALYESASGMKFHLIARSNTPGGAWPGMCWDNRVVRERAERFLKAVGQRYRECESLWGYDVWNEVFFEPHGHPGIAHEKYCYCDGSKQEFVIWLKARYGDLDGLCSAWRRKYTDWDQVYPPPFQGSYPDWLDWLRFRLERMKHQMKWRVATLREVDQNHPLTSHGVAWSLHQMPTVLADDWDIAEEVDHWGLSTFPAWGNMSATDHMHLLDISRSAAHGAGKRFWQTELQGGPAIAGLYRSYVPRAADTALWNWTSFMCGAQGMLYWQWRPELLGPESPGFGLCNIDGSPTDRVEAASWFAHFMNQHLELVESEAVPGDVAILVLPESQLFNYVTQFDTAEYANDVRGLYKALWEDNIVADFVKVDKISQYKAVYMPFPLLIDKEHAEALKQYVAQGGTLISHACPAHFDDNAYCSFAIPGAGLDELFGAVEEEVEYIPSLVSAGRELPHLEWNGEKLQCAVYQEKLVAKGGRVVARFSDGTPAVIDNIHGKGKTRLIGTFPGVSYWTTKETAAADLIRDGARFAGIDQTAKVSNRNIKARLHTGSGRSFLWVLNTADEEQSAEVMISSRFGNVQTATDLRTGNSVGVSGQTVHVTLAPKTGSVASLQTEA